jgi:hypothetical protein
MDRIGFWFQRQHDAGSDEMQVSPKTRSWSSGCLTDAIAAHVEEPLLRVFSHTFDSVTTAMHATQQHKQCLRLGVFEATTLTLPPQVMDPDDDIPQGAATVPFTYYDPLAPKHHSICIRRHYGSIRLRSTRRNEMLQNLREPIEVNTRSTNRAS